MRRRITVAILAVVIGTLVLTVAGSLLLVRRAALSTAESELTSEGQAIGSLMSSHPVFTEIDVVASLQNVGAFARLTLVGIGPGSAVVALPAPLTPGIVDVAALQAGNTVAGNVGNVVFVAQPLTLTLRQRVSLADGLPVLDQPVLVVTRTVSSPVNGMDYFLLVAGVVLVAGIVVATVLARRISAPLERAVVATRQIAGGNLAATVPLGRHDDPELAELARAVNSLSESLTHAQGLEREFLLSVSHELRTPLTSIRGYADAIAEGATDDVAGAVGIIGSEARRLERLVQDLLDLARLQARRFSLDLQRVDGAEVVAAVAEGFQPEADAAGIDVVTNTAAGELWVDADPDRLGQIVANLVGNALRFATARVEVGGTGPAPGARCGSSTTARGSAPRRCPTSSSATTPPTAAAARTSGTGLGLAVVAELAAAMGGSVNAESPVHEGRGARMVVWLPSATGAQPRGAAPSPGPPTSASPLGPPA